MAVQQHGTRRVVLPVVSATQRANSIRRKDMQALLITSSCFHALRQSDALDTKKKIRRMLQTLETPAENLQKSRFATLHPNLVCSFLFLPRMAF
jgi:hypothetical protein